MAIHANSISASAARLVSLRARAAMEIERLLALLDALDGDPDLEPDSDDEPEGNDELFIQHELRGGSRVGV